jgi:hypothetical protein
MTRTNVVRSWVSVLVSLGCATTALAQESFEGRTQAIVSHEYLSTGRTYNHPSSLAETRAGTLVFATVGGASEGESTSILVTRKPKGGAWSAFVEVTPVRQMFDPVLYQPRAPGAPLLLSYYNDCCEDARLRISNDDGVTWSDEMTLPAVNDPDYRQPRFELAEQNPPLEMPDGSLWGSVTRRGGGYNMSWLTIVPANNYTGRENGGGPWRALRIPGHTGQGALLVVKPDEQAGGVYKNFAVVERCDFFGCTGGTKITYTSDGGRTWSPDRPIEITGNKVGNSYADVHSGIAAISLDVRGGPARGWHLVAGAGNIAIQGGRIHRGCIRVVLSSDAQKWEEVLELRMLQGGEEQADPTFIQGADRKVHLLWTGRGAKTLRHVVLDPDVLVGNKAAPAPGPLPPAGDGGATTSPDGGSSPSVDAGTQQEDEDSPRPPAVSSKDASASIPPTPGPGGTVPPTGGSVDAGSAAGDDDGARRTASGGCAVAAAPRTGSLAALLLATGLLLVRSRRARSKR